MREGVRDVDHFGEDITMEKIKIAITGRVASVVALPEVVADNAEYEVNFALDPREGWDVTLPITALFVRRDGTYTPRIMDAGKTSCTMPPQTGTNIVFVGLTQDDMRTTTPAAIKVHRSIRTVAHDPLPAPSEDVYAQILAAYAGIKILSGKGAPTSATPGKVNQLYRDEDTQKLYICTATDGGYTWAAVSGGSVDVDATLTKAGYAADAKAAGDAIGKKIDAPQVAQVGEVLTVEEIGEDGKPVKWKTAPGVNITTELTQESTDAQVPSAKAAYNAIQNATDKDAVRFVAQELTDEQKEQARKNINATPKLYYWPNEKIASAVTSKYQTSNGRWDTQYEYNNILLSLPQNRNMFKFDGTNLLIIKTGTHNNIQFKIEISNSIEVARSEFKKYFGDLYFVTMVLRTDSQGYQIKNLYADVTGMTIDPVLIGMAEYEGKPGLIRINAKEYDSATYNPLVMTGSGYAVSYNEFSITTASDVGTVFRTQKAKAILVTGNIQKFVEGGFNAPYFMVQLSTEFADGIITNDYMVMAPVGVFFAIGVMSIRGTSNTVSWQINSDKFGLSLSIINGALNNLYANSLRPPTTAQPGQIVRVKAVDADGKITGTEAVDMPGEEKWELIKTIDIADGAAETTALTIDTDNNGNAFSLKKCRLFARFPAYKGETTIPNFSFTMINNGMTGDHSPLCYTSGFPKLRTDGYSGTVWEVDVSGLQQYEKVMRTSSTTWTAGVYGSINSQTTEYWGDKRIQSITSIGGAQMLIFPGCHFELHGVRE